MASYWTPSTGRVYLPPSTPLSKVLHTDDFVRRTSLFYHVKSERLLTVGNPYYEVKEPGTNKILVPKVNASQYRVFRVRLPDPNKFALSEPHIYDPDSERLVWKLLGMQIGRGQPLGISSTGHPFFNKFLDTENPMAQSQQNTDDRQNTSFDPKQIQMFIVGCTPCNGEYWEKALPCAEDAPPPKGACPPIELKSVLIQDGFMCDIGLGAMNFKTLQDTKSGGSLDIVAEPCYYPDFLKMTDDSYGNSCFFYGKREQLYSRHYFVRGGQRGEDVPEDHYLSGQAQARMGPIAYFTTPSGSLVTSESQILNRPYWLQRAQGTNNGICWNNQVFVTVVDTTRGTNFTISVRSDEEEVEAGQETYDQNKFKQYSRHVEEFELSFIFELGVVVLSPEVLAHLHNMDKNILDDWNLGVVAPPGTLEDQYRHINSQATKCPSDVPPTEKEDPYKGLTFWNVDLTDKFSSDLSQHSLGRKFLFQSNLQSRASKRPGSKRVSFKSGQPAKKRARKQTS
ncbi:L1 [Capra hircus papillomavirus 1]|uniref:Major capsid protein L1 n=3 Tax=Capra hircus papillomavirus 1 TaxID=338903 RepID=Q1I121_9PAPI|nr:L1 [Capra hircus papillomavirus 1]AAZ39807.1 L1 [Capra hircus papillomavirus 1]